MVVDADYSAASGLGFQKTVDRVIEIVQPFGFKPKPVSLGRPGGILFSSAHGFHDFGLWVMPGNLVDGVLEDWVQQCIAPLDRSLLAEAQNATAALATPKFKELHRPKAEVATWLSWQKAPGRGLESTIKENLLDVSNRQFLLLVSWLEAVFS